VLPEAGEQLIGKFLDRSKLVAPQVRATEHAQSWEVLHSPSNVGTQRPMTQLGHKYTCHWTMPGIYLILAKRPRRKAKDHLEIFIEYWAAVIH
jgi:hypothetical protein